MPEAPLMHGKTSKEERSLTCNQPHHAFEHSPNLKKKPEEILCHLITTDEH